MRRGLDITEFVRGSKDLQEARQKFLDNQIIPPADEVILSILVKDSPLSKAMKKRADAQAPQTPSNQTKKSAVEEKSKAPKPRKQKKYFRKVLSPKSGESDE